MLKKLSNLLMLFECRASNRLIYSKCCIKGKQRCPEIFSWVAATNVLKLLPLSEILKKSDVPFAPILFLYTDGGPNHRLTFQWRSSNFFRNINLWKNRRVNVASIWLEDPDVIVDFRHHNHRIVLNGFVYSFGRKLQGLGLRYSIPVNSRSVSWYSRDNFGAVSSTCVSVRLQAAKWSLASGKH